jgi:hypothetical protein
LIASTWHAIMAAPHRSSFHHDRVALARPAHGEARRRYEEALSLWRQVGDLQGEAGCIKCPGDIALDRSDHAEARGRFEQDLELYRRIPEPYSIGGAHVRLARIAATSQD